MKKAGDVRMIHVHDACFRNDLALKTMYQLRSFNDIPKKLMVDTESAIQKHLTDALGNAPQFVKQAYRMLLETGSHDITVLRGTFGDPEKILHTEIWPGGNWFASTLDYGGNVRCLFDIARTARNWGDEHITVFGMTKTVSVVFPIPFHRNSLTIVKLTGMSCDSTAEQVIVPNYAVSFRNERIHFADCVNRKKTPLTSLAEGRKDTELMTKIIKKFKA
jgi:predicted dehydrogenase